MSGLRPRLLATTDQTFSTELDALLAWDVSTDSVVNQRAAAIIERLRTEGESALLELTHALDQVRAASVAELMLGPEDFRAAFDRIAAQEREALQTAAARIRAFHEQQKQPGWEFEDEQGNRLGQRVTPLDSVGLYVPGGQAAYPSTVLMTAIPARVAGVGTLIMVSPTPGGVVNDLVLAAAHLAGVDCAYRVGGAQAIAALAFGTAGIPKVDKIVGPGSSYVAAAKRLVYGQVGIDAIAGPSEILIIGDGSVDPDWIALDLFSQAEHDAAAQSILLTPDAGYRDAVLAAMNRAIADQPRASLIADSIANRGALILTRSVDEAVDVANRIAPEHLELAVAEPRKLLPRLRHAGAVFLGARASESLGDYVAGPSHVLPTFGTARFSSPLGVYDFEKRSSLIEISATGAEVLGRAASVLADGEGLNAHGDAARARIRGYGANQE
ncbi:MAG: histidinol dehydrogenase [Pseudomonadota bacterium]